jgi:YidC/Oxa1 family membrane protein insertase
MGNIRPVLIMGLLFLGYLMWIEWQKDYGPAPQAPAPQSVSTTSEQTPPAADIPDLATSMTPAADLPAPETAGQADVPGSAEPGLEASRDLIRVETDVLEVLIDRVGGTVVSAVLRNYPVTLDEPDVKIDMLQQDGPAMFIVQSGLLSHEEAPNHTSVFSASGDRFTLDGSQQELRVPLSWQGANGVNVTKTYVFRPGRYDIEVRHRVENRGNAAWSGSRYLQLQRSVPGDSESAGFTNPERYSFFGIGFYNPEDKFEKIGFDDVAGDPYNKNTADGWLAMIQHYFFAAWIPEAGQQSTFTTQAIQTGGWPRYIARNVSPAQQVAPGQSTEFTSTLFLGPKLQDEIPEIAPGLEYTVNYGIFTVFSKPLYWLLSKIHGVVGNWGWAIVILTILIKLAFFKLTEAQYRSTARMRKLQPRIEQLKERYGDDRQRMSQAMMELYKKEKVNPLGGCLPILVQIPIFIALYWVLLESVELRQAPFILWIDNLSVRDPYFILPLLNAAFMFATQRLTPMVGMDPLQQKMMQAMPIVFSIMFAFFPAGLVLYWATNAGLSLAQQYYITRKIAASD